MLIEPENIKMGYILQYKRVPKNFFHEKIFKAQRAMGFSLSDSEYIHVEVSGGDWDAVYAKTPKSIPIDIRLAHGGAYVRVLKYIGYTEDVSDRLRLKVAYFSGQLCNIPYDWAGVTRFIAPWMFQSKKRYFCSEGAAWSLQKGFPGDVRLNHPAEDWMPAHFGTSEGLFLVVDEGFIPKLSNTGKKRVKLNIKTRTPFNNKIVGAGVSIKF